MSLNPAFYSRPLGKYGETIKDDGDKCSLPSEREKRSKDDRIIKWRKLVMVSDRF